MTISFRRLHKCRDKSTLPDRKRFQESRALNVRFCGTRYGSHARHTRVRCIGSPTSDLHPVSSRRDLSRWMCHGERDWRSEIGDAILNLPKLLPWSKTIIQCRETCLKSDGCTRSWITCMAKFKQSREFGYNLYECRKKNLITVAKYNNSYSRCKHDFGAFKHRTIG